MLARWLKYGILTLLFAGAVVFYLVPQLFDHWTSVVRLSPSPTPVVLPPPADAEVDPAYVESLTLDGIRFAYPHLSLSVECESKWAKIGDQWVPMAACWSEGQTGCVHIDQTLWTIGRRL